MNGLPALRPVYFLHQAIVVALYASVAHLLLKWSAENGFIGLLWLPSGLAMAVVLMYGRSYWLGVWLGAFGANLLMGGMTWLAALIAIGNTLEAVLGHWLLTRRRTFDLTLESVEAYLSLIFLAGGVSTLVSAINGATWLLVAGAISPAVYWGTVGHWWSGHMLGVGLFAPIILVWRTFPMHWIRLLRLPEALLLITLTVVVGNTVFLDWFADILGLHPRAFLMLIFTTWAAVRFGTHGVTVVLVIVLVQGVSGLLMKVGYFGRELHDASVFNFWVYYAELAVLGHLLAASLAESKRNERNLKEGKTAIRKTLEGLPDPYYRVDSSGRITYCTEAAEAFFGCPKSQLLGRNLADFYADPAERETIVRAILAAKGEYVTVEARLKRVDGQMFWASTRARAVFDERGRFAGVEGSARDLSDHIAMEQELRQHRDHLESLLRQQQAATSAIVETAVDGIITIDQRGIVTSFNPAAERMFGYPAAEIVGGNINRLMPEPHAGSHDGYLRRYVEGGAPRIINRTVEVDGRRKDGSRFPIQIAVSEIQDGGDEKRFAGIVRDVSERKRIEQELRRSLAEADAANKAKSQFLSRMSHEMRTPLNMLLGYTDLLATEPDHATIGAQRENLAIMAESGATLLGIIDDLLDLSAIEAGKLALKMATVNVDDAVRGTLAALAPLAARHQVELQAEYGNEAHQVRADALRLRQVLTNLVSNAIKYNRAGGRVLVSFEQRNERLRISVTDSGPGIEERDLASLFKAFSRLHKRSFEIEGAGIGLAIAKQLMELMGGEIGVESVVGQGSTFWIELMLDVSDPESATAAS